MAFANHAAIALENAELYRQQESHARTLEQTIAEREQLIEELDAFAHTVAHDLKNPLRLMVGYAEMLSVRKSLTRSRRQQLHFTAGYDRAGRRQE